MRLLSILLVNSTSRYNGRIRCIHFSALSLHVIKLIIVVLKVFPIAFRVGSLTISRLPGTRMGKCHGL